MIKVNVKKDKKNITKIVLQGHALYDDLGKDIVCAAVSSATINTINGILSINETIKTELEEDKLIIKVLKKDLITQKLLQNLINNLKEIELDYKDNLKIKEE